MCRYASCGDDCDTVRLMNNGFSVWFGSNCTTNGNGECEDGGPGASLSSCAFGQDSADCGGRAVDGLGFCEHSCRGSTAYNVFIIATCLIVSAMCLVASGKSHYSTVGRGAQCRWMAMFVLSYGFFFIIAVSFIGTCHSPSIAMSGIMYPAVVCFAVATGAIGTGLLGLMCGCIPRSLLLSYVHACVLPLNVRMCWPGCLCRGRQSGGRAGFVRERACHRR